MGKKAELHYEGIVYEIPVVTGTENENALDISKLREQSGLITLDRGFKNTGSTESAITFLNGEEGILRYSGEIVYDLGSCVSGKICSLIINSSIILSTI